MLNRLVNTISDSTMCLNGLTTIKEDLTTETQRTTERLRAPLCLCGCFFQQLQLFCLLTALCLLSGCSTPIADYSRVALVKGSGQVTLDQQPLAGAVITFEDPADDTFSYAMTDDKGHYTLQFDSEMEGVKCGQKIVRISTTRKLLGLTSPPGQGEGDLPTKQNQPAEKVPVRYNRKSELMVEVTRSGGPFNFDLKSK